MFPICSTGQEPHVSAPQWHRIRLLGCHEQADLSVSLHTNVKPGVSSYVPRIHHVGQPKRSQDSPDLIRIECDKNRYPSQVPLLISRATRSYRGLSLSLKVGYCTKVQFASILLPRDPPAPQSHHQHGGLFSLKSLVRLDAVAFTISCLFVFVFFSVNGKRWTLTAWHACRTSTRNFIS